MPIGLDELRRLAVRRSLFPPTTLKRAVQRLGFVQADPIRAPARAQDLTLRHRVTGYRAGDLERRYATLGIEEDVFINYGFVTADVHALMHPRRVAPKWPAAGRKRTEDLLAFVRDQGVVHPREAHARFAHGTVTNYWGGSSNATTHLLDDLHYRGLLRVVRREAGIRIYGARERGGDALEQAVIRARVDALIDVVVGIYAPLPRASFSWVLNRLRYAVPQWRDELRGGVQRAQQRLARASVDGMDWYWPDGERADHARTDDTVRLLSPFDPVVWDRRRFELLWGWAYRFEAYTPAAKRQRGYYALPLVWRDRVIGWGNISLRRGALHSEIGYVDSTRSGDRVFKRELERELERMRIFLAAAQTGRLPS